MLSRVAIVRTDRLGELVLTLALARRLRQVDPAIAVTMVVAPGMEELVSLCPDVAEVLTHGIHRDVRWCGGAYRLGQRLRAGGYDAVIVANPTKEAHLASWLSRTPVRIGYDCKCGRYLLTHVLPAERPVAAKHEAQWNVDLLTPLGIHGPAPYPRLDVVRIASQAVVRRWVEWGLDAAQRLVVVHPWASEAPKRWPMVKFCALAQRVAALESVQVVLVGSPDHQEESKHLDGPWIDLTGRTSLSDLALLLSRASCLVSNDSGPVHVAAALRVPVVALFGTADSVRGPRRWGPCGDGHTVIARASMEAIAVEEVARAVESRITQLQSIDVDSHHQPLWHR